MKALTARRYETKTISSSCAAVSSSDPQEHNKWSEKKTANLQTCLLILSESYKQVVPLIKEATLSTYHPINKT